MIDFEGWARELASELEGRETKFDNISLGERETMRLSEHNMQVEEDYFEACDFKDFEEADLVDYQFIRREYGRSNKTR